MHRQNIMLHQLVSIATNELCDFTRLFLVVLEEKLKTLAHQCIKKIAKVRIMIQADRSKVSS
jgi:hypothetical protein